MKNNNIKMKFGLIILCFIATVLHVNAQVSSVNGLTGDVEIELSRSGNDLSLTEQQSVSLPFGQGNITSLLNGTGITAIETSNTVTVNANNSEPIWNADRLLNTPVSVQGLAPNKILKFNGSAWLPSEDEPGGGLTTSWNPVDTNYYFDINDGALSIGTLDNNASLTVDGKIHAKELIVKVETVVPDYVFEESYDLRPLKEVDNYIKTNKHLPEIPSADEMEKEQINLSEINMLLLKKVEELTLYVIQNEKRIKELEN